MYLQHTLAYHFTSWFIIRFLVISILFSWLVLKNEEKCSQKVKREMDFGHF
jgi:hypothetical protein